jgi:hypothetical protein
MTILAMLVNHQSGAPALKVARRSFDSVISRALIGPMLPHLMRDLPTQGPST